MRIEKLNVLVDRLQRENTILKMGRWSKVQGLPAEFKPKVE